MGTWIKETDEAIYLMQGGYWISRVTKHPSQTNPQERVLNIAGLQSWFTRPDFPAAMTISYDPDGPEPQPLPTAPPEPEAPDPGDGGTGTPVDDWDGMQIQVISTTYFKRQPKLSSELNDSQKVLVQNGSVFNIEYYVDVGNNHWQVELFEPTLGDQKTTSWYVYTPDIKLLTDTTVTTISDTLFKLEPKLSSALPESSKVFVENKTTFKLVSHLPAADNHVKLELADATLGSNKEKIWYAYMPDVKLQGDRQTLEIISDTLFKTSPVLSSQLGDADKIFVKNGTVFELNSYAQPDKNHVKVALQGAFLGPQNRNTWYAYVPDIMISGTEIGNNPDDSKPDKPTNSADRGFAMKFPGYEGTYYSKDPIYWETQYGERGHFTWGEALHADASGNYRHPANSSVVDGILRVAKVMEDIRKMYGDVPIQINSWYRDPATNAAVGGASRSRHMSGDAVDFVVPGVHPYDVYARLDPWWGSKGGLASSTVFTHIDVRGYKARWDYGY